MARRISSGEMEPSSSLRADPILELSSVGTRATWPHQDGGAVTWEPLVPKPARKRKGPPKRALGGRGILLSRPSIPGVQTIWTRQGSDGNAGCDFSLLARILRYHTEI